MAVQAKDVPLVLVLRAIEDATQDRSYDRAPWWRRGGLEKYPNKVLFAKLEKRSVAKLYDYGVSMNYPWLTPAGKAKLAELEQVAG